MVLEPVDPIRYDQMRKRVDIACDSFLSVILAGWWRWQGGPDSAGGREGRKGKGPSLGGGGAGGREWIKRRR